MSSGLEITEAGKQLYESAKQLLLDLDNIIKQVKSADRVQKRTIRLELTILSSILYMDIFMDILKKYP